MKTLEIGNAVIDVTDDLHWYETHIFLTLNSSLEEAYKLLLSQLAGYLAQCGFPAPGNIRVLDGHGTVHRDVYTLYEEPEPLNGHHRRPRYTPIDEWRDMHDGNYGALYIFSCNARHLTLQPGKSLVLYPMNEWSPLTANWLGDEYLHKNVRILPPLHRQVSS